MDLDLDLENDHISDFLQSKLHEIKLTNAQLEKSLCHRQNVSSTLQQEIEQGSTSNQVQIDTVCEKIFNNKYVFNVGLRTVNHTKLENVNVTLDWNSSSPLSYKFYLISSNSPSLLIDGLKCTDHLKQFGQIIIVLEVPFFAEQLAYTIVGSINFKQDGKKSTLKLPSVIQLTPKDIFDSSLLVQVHKVIEGSIDDFLACAFSSEKHEFVMVIPTNWTRLLQTTLEVDCGLYRVNIASNKKFFIAQKICSVLDGALLEVEDDEFTQNQFVHFNVYCRNRNELITLIHYLHKNIANAIIVPKPLFCPEMSLQDATELIKESILEELGCLASFSGKNLIDFRCEMASLEHKTDLLISRLNKNAN